MRKHKEQLALERIEEFQPDAAANSGGKDSVVCDHLMRRVMGSRFQSFMNLTTVDPKIHLNFMRQAFPHTERIHPEKSMFQLIIEHGLPSRKIRFCCEHLKERVQRGSFVVFGVRWAESQTRKTRPMFHYHPKNKPLKVLNPIIDWTDRDVWQYMETHHLPVSPLYRSPYNFARVGCIGCPMAGRTVNKEFRLFPEFKRYYIAAIARRMRRPRKRGAGFFFDDFQDAEQVFRWWVSQSNKATFMRQQEFSFCMD